MNPSEARLALTKVTDSLKNKYLAYQINQFVNKSYSLPVTAYKRVKSYPGLSVSGEAAIYVSGNPTVKNVRLSGCDQSSIYIGANSKLIDCSLNLIKGVVVFGCYSDIKKAYSKVSDGIVGFGNAVSVESGTFVVDESTEIHVGDESMFSSEISMRTCDGHSIYSKDLLKRLNHSKSIYIGPHNWLGRNVSINKGVVTGNDCIVGQGSLAVGSIPNNVVAAGQPAKIVKENVTWGRALVEEDYSESDFEKNYQAFILNGLQHIRESQREKFEVSSGISLVSFMLSNFYEQHVYSELQFSPHLKSIWEVCLEGLPHSIEGKSLGALSDQERVLASLE